MQWVVTPRQTIGAAVVLAGSLALVAWLVAWGGNVFTAPQQCSINITRADYDAALAKWRAQDIGAYDMILDLASPRTGGADCLGCGTYSLSVQGKDVTLRNYISPTVGYATPADQYDLSKSYTVDGLFEEVDGLLTAGPHTCERFPMALVFDYTIKFDPQLGYPAFIGRVSRDTEGHPASTLECGGGIITEVRSLKVIKSGVKFAP